MNSDKEVAGASCWHCGVVLAYVPTLRCEDCPTECDVEGCEEMGCATPTPPVPAEVAREVVDVCEEGEEEFK